MINEQITIYSSFTSLFHPYGGIISNCDWHKQNIKINQPVRKGKCAASPNRLTKEILLYCSCYCVHWTPFFVRLKLGLDKSRRPGLVDSRSIGIEFGNKNKTMFIKL